MGYVLACDTNKVLEQESLAEYQFHPGHGYRSAFHVTVEIPKELHVFVGKLHLNTGARHAWLFGHNARLCLRAQDVELQSYNLELAQVIAIGSLVVWYNSEGDIQNPETTAANKDLIRIYEMHCNLTPCFFLNNGVRF